MKEKALFIDRDGVINNMVIQENGLFDSPQNLEQVSLVDGISEVVRWANENKIPVIMISNQPGVALGKMDMVTMENIEGKINDLLKRKGVVIDKIYKCLHHPKAVTADLKIACDCRKPKPGLIEKAALENDIELTSSVFLGDNVTDLEAGNTAGCKTILFLHKMDLPDKVKRNYAHPTKYKSTNHKESLRILIELLK